MRKIVAIAGIAALSLAWAVLPAGAGINATFDINPNTGPPGTVIHASGDDQFCSINGEDVFVALVDPQEKVVASVTTKVVLGEWAVDITVPANAAPGGYIVTARCTDGESSFTYNAPDFVVTAGTNTTTTVAPTTTTTTVATTTTTVAPQPVPVAPAAAPVVAAPVMTG